MRTDLDNIYTGLYGADAIAAVAAFIREKNKKLSIFGKSVAVSYTGEAVIPMAEWAANHGLTEEYADVLLDEVKCCYVLHKASLPESYEKTFKELEKALRDPAHPWRQPLTPFEQRVVELTLTEASLLASVGTSFVDDGERVVEALRELKKRSTGPDDLS